MLIGICGLLLEGYNPGVMLPGVAGTICLLLALFAFQILSVNLPAWRSLRIGVGMMVAEFFFSGLWLARPRWPHRLHRRVAHSVRSGVAGDDTLRCR